jgi:hypothetical protein
VTISAEEKLVVEMFDDEATNNANNISKTIIDFIKNK